MGKNNKALFQKLSRKLMDRQSASRYRHSLSVAEWAAQLGRAHGWSVERARLAGLLHDYAKEWSPKKLKKYVKKRRLSIPNLSFILKTSPNMLHAYVSAEVAKQKKWITNKKDLRAISSHTLGRKKMGLEEKILFVADFSAPGRAYSSAAMIRKIAIKNLEQGFRETLARKIGWHLLKSKPLHPLVIQVWNQVVGGC